MEAQATEPAPQAPAPAGGQPAPTEGQAPSTVVSTARAPISNVSDGLSRTATRASVRLSGYVEAFYQWNFNEPSNGITNYRGFDTRHDTFTLSNVVLDASWSLGAPRISGRLALQVGHTPETYYLAEPSRPGSAVTGASSFDVWKFVQQANVAWHAPVGNTLLLEAGIFPEHPGGRLLPTAVSEVRNSEVEERGKPFVQNGDVLRPDVAVRVAGIGAVPAGTVEASDASRVIDHAVHRRGGATARTSRPPPPRR